jgi:hypothetical protein
VQGTLADQTRCHPWFRPPCSTFSNPSPAERRAYGSFWQNKLASNDKTDVSFPDTLLDAFAKGTEGFSFAYLKEALYVRLRISLFRSSPSSLILPLSPGSQPTTVLSAVLPTLASRPCYLSLERTRTRRSLRSRAFCWSRFSSFERVSARRTSQLRSNRRKPSVAPLFAHVPRLDTLLMVVVPFVGTALTTAGTGKGYAS